jgi:hypothetical protein
LWQGAVELCGRWFALRHTQGIVGRWSVFARLAYCVRVVVC